VTVRDFEFKARRYINEYLTPPKNCYKMERLMGLLSNLKKELSAVVRIANERDLFLALEAENILDSAILSTLASLERKESRWGFWHSRGDYPARNDENWLHHIDIKQNTNTGAPNLLPRPVRRLNEIGGS
jgi:succinate dehydrogenase/fumarate reductase flavoprotein subunit